ncbi:hypothetical protein MLD38_035863 [Melastoma candidum]|uniref:Uncharacterized protein n=1 Tax=Melastoma candidum TaxID=119954 RepID=A0ACB9LI59_9MYRT|nr:hypothetical protein MLD38_035863 [Melastoma candidum]
MAYYAINYTMIDAFGCVRYVSLTSLGFVVHRVPDGYLYAVMDGFCEKTCERLGTLEVTAPTPFAEQDFLNMYLKDNYRPIPKVYNLVLANLWRHPENMELDKVNVVHYCAAGSKPWRYTGKEDNMDG